MVVMEAHRVGLAQLHQLRGRVGRGAERSYCVLVTKMELSQTSRRRIAIMTESTDGFEIAEEDLKLRGPGDFLEQSFGKTRQSGEFDLGIASLEKDVKLLYTAFDEAKRVLAEDPELESEENQPLAKALRERVFKRQGVL